MVVTLLREGHSVYVLQPEGKKTPTCKVHPNNLRPCPLNVLQENTVPAVQEVSAADQPNQLPPPTRWLPRLITSSVEHLATQTIDLVQAEPPDPPEGPCSPHW